jgi:hypothetical protein
MEHAGPRIRAAVTAPAAHPGTPLWLRTVYRLERAVGEPLETLLRSDAYFDAVTELLRARHRYGRAVEGVSRRLLHLLNLPAGTDIRRVREQLARVERQLAGLGIELDELKARGDAESADREEAWPPPSAPRT